MIDFSIIIPTKNIPDLLNRCLMSIPDSEDVQVIVVDDNSSADIVDFDHYPQIIHNNVIMKRTFEGKGAGYARNVGLTLSKGKWLLFADSDDYFVDGFYDIIKKHVNSTSDMILFKAESVDSETKVVANRNENINKRIDECLEGKITAKEASIAVQSPWCRMIRRDFVEKNHIRFDEIIACNDAMFTTKATCMAKRLEVSTDFIYVVTYRQGSLWSVRKTNPENYLIRLKVLIRRNKYVSKFGFKAIPVVFYVKSGLDVSITVFLKAFWIAVSKGALLQGMGDYIKQKLTK